MLVDEKLRAWVVHHNSSNDGGIVRKTLVPNRTFAQLRALPQFEDAMFRNILVAPDAERREHKVSLEHIRAVLQYLDRFVAIRIDYSVAVEERARSCAKRWPYGIEISTFAMV